MIDLSGLKHFKTDLGTYVLGDAREVLKRLPPNSVDVVITDPPWGVGFDEYDDFNVFLQVRDELYRVMKSDSWLVFFLTPRRLFDIYPYLQKFTYRWVLIYVYAGFGTHSLNPLGSQTLYGMILVLSKGSGNKPKIFTKRRDVIFSDELPVVEGNIREPQFKPTYTVSVLVTMFSREGDLVLDPFAGYGSIPLVCELFNRRWLAVEVDEVKYTIAEKIVKSRKVPDIKKLKDELTSRRKGKTITEFINQSSRPTS